MLYKITNNNSISAGLILFTPTVYPLYYVDDYLMTGPAGFKTYKNIQSILYSTKAKALAILHWQL